MTPSPSLRADQIAFLLLVASVPFMRFLGLPLAGMTITATDFLFPFAVLLALRAWWRGDLALPRGLFAGFSVIYLSLLALSLLQAADWAHATAKLVANAYLVGLGLLTYVQCIDPRSLRLSAIAWAAAASVTSVAMLLGAVLFFAGIRDPSVNVVLWDLGSLPAGKYPRLAGFFLNANMACSYLTVGLLLIAALALRHGVISLRAAALLIVVLLACLSTLSPGLGGTALAGGILLWLLLYWSGAPFCAWGCLAVGVTLAAFMLVVTASYPNLDAWRAGHGLAFEPSPRWLTWQSALDKLLDRPILGWGLGAPLADVDYTTPSGVAQHHQDPHNVWLSLAGQTGLIGLSGFALLLLYLARGMRHLGPKDVDVSSLRTCLSLALVAVLYHSLSMSLEETRHVWLLFGLLGAALDGDPPQRPRHTGLRFSMKARRPSA